ncbi:MAG TPA: hypothetical protein PLF68_17605, partial [Nitrospira sp.]|nr:hypothetical protein [Nitrospira sp.]
MSESLKAMIEAGFRAMRGGVDLSVGGRFGQSSGFLSGVRHESWQDPVRPAHGFPALDDLLALRP